MDCKHCHSEHFHKSGFTRGKQRYKCKDCGRYFVVGDERTNDKIIGTKASYSMLGKVFDRDRSLIYRCPEKQYSKKPVSTRRNRRFPKILRKSNLMRCSIF